MITRHRPALLAGLLATTITVLAGSTARADVLFSTFGTGDTYASTGGLPVSGANSGYTRFAEADRFTAGFSGALSQVDVAVNLSFQVPASAGFVDLQIAPNDPATNLPLAASALTLGTIQATSSTPAILSLTAPSSAYAFTAGSTYWLILAPHDTSTNVIWEGANNPGATLTAYMSQTSGGQFQSSTNGANAFRVSATVVPEPSTCTLSLAAALLFWGVAWRQRRGHTDLRRGIAT